MNLKLCLKNSYKSFALQNYRFKSQASSQIFRTKVDNKIPCYLTFKRQTYFSTIKKNSSAQQNLDYLQNSIRIDEKIKQRLQIENKIKYWSEVNREYLMRHINYLKNNPRNKNKKQDEPKSKQAHNINKQRPVNTINGLIMLLKDYNNKRFEFINIQNNNENKDYSSNILSQTNQVVHATTVEIISTLHYMVSSLDFNFGAYGENESQSQIQFPYIGTLMNTLIEMLSFNCLPLSPQFDKLMVSFVQLTDLYLTSFMHLINSPLEHLYVDDACGRLAKMKVNYPLHAINKLIKTKYGKKQVQNSKLILFHKSFLDIKSLPSYSQTSLSDYSYTYSEIDGSYFSFVKDQIRKIIIDTKAKKALEMFQKQLDMLIELDRKGESKIRMIKDIPLYIQWVRRFYLYEDVNQQTPKIMLRLQFCIESVIQFMIYSRTHEQYNTQISSGLFDLDFQESLVYLTYFYLTFCKNLSSSQFIDENDVGDFNQMIYDFARKILSTENLGQRSSQLSFLRQNPLLQYISSPKLACIQLQIFYNLIKLQDQIHNKKLKKRQKQFVKAIHQVLINYLSQKTYKNFPYLYLTWFYDRMIDIFALSQIEYVAQYKRSLLFGVIQAFTESNLNKLSHLNRIHTIFPVITHLLEESKKDTKALAYHDKILTWLSSHSRYQLLTQDEDELCDIFQYFIPLKLIYCEFLSIVVNVSFGEFNWQGFNKLYYHCLLYYSFQQTEHKLKQSFPEQMKKQKHTEKQTKQNLTFSQDDKRQINQEQRMNMEYMRRYILNQYNAMGIRRRQVPLNSYFYKILELQTPQTFYKNYFQNYGNQ